MRYYRKFLALFMRKCEEEPLEVTPISVTSLLEGHWKLIKQL